MKEGKIIVITGGPRSGKSTLVWILAKYYNGISYLEDERKIPKKIIEDIKRGVNSVEIILWFRNFLVCQYIDAIKNKRKGKYCFVDCFWLTNQAYINTWVKNKFENKLLTGLVNVDTNILPWPDKVIVLEQNKEEMKKFSKIGGRSFENSDAYLEEMHKVNKLHNSFFKKISKKKNNIILINRSGLDFVNNKKDFKKIIDLVD